MQVKSMAATAPIALAPAAAEAPCEAHELEPGMAADALVTASGAPTEAVPVQLVEPNFWIQWIASTWFYRSFGQNWFRLDPSDDEKKDAQRRNKAQDGLVRDARAAAAQKSRSLTLKQCLEACKDLQDAAQFQLKVASLNRSVRQAAQ